jgi:hypothetical protein
MPFAIAWSTPLICTPVELAGAVGLVGVVDVGGMPISSR